MGDDDLDLASPEYWREGGYRGRPPWRRGYRWSYFAISLALAALIVGLVWLLAHAA
jgi:hypothetical protein